MHDKLRVRWLNYSYTAKPRVFHEAGKRCSGHYDHSVNNLANNEQNCAALDTNVAMVARVREVFIEQGIEALTLTRKKRETPPIPRIFDGEAEAKLIAFACSTPPEGHARWTIRLLRRT